MTGPRLCGMNGAMNDAEVHLDDAEGDGPLIFGRVLDGKGGARPIGWAEAQGWRPGAPGEVLWLHLQRTEAGVHGWLQADLGIPEPTA